jgi:hypothetical protein
MTTIERQYQRRLARKHLDLRRLFASLSPAKPRTTLRAIHIDRGARRGYAASTGASR